MVLFAGPTGFCKAQAVNKMKMLSVSVDQSIKWVLKLDEEILPVESKACNKTLGNTVIRLTSKEKLKETKENFF